MFEVQRAGMPSFNACWAFEVQRVLERACAVEMEAYVKCVKDQGLDWENEAPHVRTKGKFSVFDSEGETKSRPPPCVHEFNERAEP